MSIEQKAQGLVQAIADRIIDTCIGIASDTSVSGMTPAEARDKIVRRLDQYKAGGNVLMETLSKQEASA